MRIVIVEDQVLLREGLARLFEDGGHQVVARGRTATGQAATVSADVQVGLPDSATETTAVAPRRSPTDSDDPRLWIAVLGGSLLTIVLLRRRLERASATAR